MGKHQVEPVVSLQLNVVMDCEVYDQLLELIDPVVARVTASLPLPPHVGHVLRRRH